MRVFYHPITATPFAHNESYMEFAPCEALKPYIKCFWGTKEPYRHRKTDIPTRGIVTPDTCVDIIFTVDFTNNRIDGGFCGIDDRTFTTYDANDEEKVVSIFAIRFFAWCAVLFSEESMSNTRNAFFEVGHHFSKLQRVISPCLFDITDMESRIRLAEEYLMKHIHPERRNTVLTDAVFEMLKRKGNVEIGQLAKDIHTSSRHLERLFQGNIGISPKRLASLVRYQYLWNDILFQPEFQVLDAVHQYGYTDQAHLLHDFKRFHTMNIKEAREYAFKHGNSLPQNEICETSRFFTISDLTF
ncbi:MAG: helix-turn-helix domain-containing protein [Lachnospiraceae bacterium]|nr:helix-turn-helix domain-containing protein [Lachnospiraceae bacterium]